MKNGKLPILDILLWLGFIGYIWVCFYMVLGMYGL